MEQIDGHWVRLSRGVARGLVHRLISYGQNHEMIMVVRSSRDPSRLINLDCDFGYQDFKRHEVSHPFHWETLKHEMIICFSISTTGTSKDRGSLFHCIGKLQNAK
jgi:hypothetical protein